jgi:glutamate/tyrosine decarboxylase-like PLP-dependent enzyme
MARLLDRSIMTPFDVIALDTIHMELADSITGDGHKLFNVPYDCGLFFSRHPDISLEVFGNPGAPYLASGDNADGILSPLNVGIENSRRFRALPLYASLRTYGTEWYKDMLERQIRTARLIAKWIAYSPHYVLLPSWLDGDDEEDEEEDEGEDDEEYKEEDEGRFKYIFIIVLFKAKDAGLNESLVRLVNAGSKIHVSGTVWQGQKAARIAVANWKVDPKRESETVIAALDGIALRAELQQ